jgi:xanthine dehydrogenase small subunit
MTGLCEENAQLDDAVLRQGLTGNLCRCTGYAPILAAGREADGQQYDGINGTYDTEELYRTLSEIQSDGFTIECISAERRRRVMSPATIAEALDCLSAWPEAKIVAGATDVGVQINKRTIDPDVYLDLNRISELEAIEQHESAGRHVWDVGARASWTQLEQLSQSEVPELWKIISVFGAPQIRHVGTIGGNIVNASPIADSLPFLLVMEATLELQSVAGSRRVNINDFYHGYKEFDLAPGELLTRVRIPLPRQDDLLRLYKVSRRRDLDIATFTAAILMRLDGNTISDASVAFGAVGPTVLRAAQTEQFLVGKPFCEETFFSAGEIAVTDVHPISDVRGSADYRYRLTRNSLLKFYYENAATNAA